MPNRQSLPESEAFAKQREIAGREGLHWFTVNILLTLTQVSPEFIEQCLAGRQPRTLTLRWLTRQRLPDDWRAQRELFARFE